MLRDRDREGTVTGALMMWESHSAESILGSEMEGQTLSGVGLSWGRGVGTDGVGEGVKSHSTGSPV